MIEIKKKTEWDSIIDQCVQYDFYHTWQYHHICEKQGDGTPILLVVYFNTDFVAFPVLRRQILDKNNQILGVDYTSVYGYVGPVCSKGINKNHYNSFHSAFKAHCEENKIISVFTRLHPMLNQNLILEGMGKVEYCQETVYQKLDISLEEQFKNYNKSNQNLIRAIRKKCQVVWSDGNINDIEKFHEIYTETMQRVGASSYYFFDQKYFYELINTDSYSIKIAFVEYEGKKVACSMFSICNQIMQYHLSGTLNEYLKLGPNRILLDEARLMANKMNCDVFHLGGGASTDPKDSLLFFKQRFSKLRSSFYLFKYIADKQKYNELVQIVGNSELVETSQYFPLYRA